MTVNDIDFLREATMRICSGLDIDKVLDNCFDCLKQYFPMNAILVNIYDKEMGVIKNIASRSEYTEAIYSPPIVLTPEAKRLAEQAGSSRVVIFNRMGDHLVARMVQNALKIKVKSSLVLNLKTVGKLLGVVGLLCSRPDCYSSEHARLLALLYMPFALVLSNTLRYQQAMEVEEKLADDNTHPSQGFQSMMGHEIIGEDSGLKNVMVMVRQVARLDCCVLVLGETGVGKEIISNAIHYFSARRDGPLVKVNCGAIPESLLDSELFGYEKGAFTGAVFRRRGRFERAHRGSILLDEIGELLPQAQTRLLRVLENMEIEPVGGERPVRVDTRIIASTNRNLVEMVQAGTFREDLWYRLNVFPITVPPLRHRVSDIPALVNYFIKQKSKQMDLDGQPELAPGNIERLQSYHWPGNVRELEHAVERALIRNRQLSTDGFLTIDDLGSSVVQGQKSRNPGQKALPLKLDEAITHHIESVLSMVNGKVQGKEGAAALLGINPNTLRSRMKKLKIPYGKGQKKGRGSSNSKGDLQSP